MTPTIKVKPSHDKCPPHPTHGKLRAEGGSWPADQFTFRRIRDKDIERISDEPSEPSAPVEAQEQVEPAEAEAPTDSPRKRR